MNEIEATRRRLSLLAERASDGTWRTVAEQPPVNTEKAATAFGFPRMHAYIAQLAAYTDAVLSGMPPPVSGADGRACVAIGLALLEKV